LKRPRTGWFENCPSTSVENSFIQVELLICQRGDGFLVYSEE
jgi:hypothetical protein